MESAIAETAAPEAVEVVVVTGSRIPRSDAGADAGSPVVTVPRETIERHGALEIEDLLNTLPQVTPDFSRTANNPGDGTAHVNLRSLGASRTLVLLNGRRLSSSDAGTAIDLNQIPEVMLERIDIVTGGTSAVYGSDAIAGVVNFVTRRDFLGVDIGWQGDIYGAGDGAVNDGHIVWGTQALEGRAHITAYVDYLRREPVLDADRKFSSQRIGDDKDVGELFHDGTVVGPQGTIDQAGSIAGVSVAGMIFDPAGKIRAFNNPDDLYDFAADNYLQTPLTRVSAGVFADVDLAQDTHLVIEGMYSDPRVDSRLAPSPLSTTINVPINTPFFTPQAQAVLSTNFDKDGDGVARFRFRRRLVEAGPRFDQRQRTYWRGVIGLDGRLADWNWQIAYSYDDNETDERLENGGSLSRLLQGINVSSSGACINPSNGCVAANVFGEGQLSAAAVDFIRIPSVSQFTRSKQQVATASATGSLFQLPEGPLHVALGVEWRRVEAIFQPDQALATGDVLGFTALQPVHGVFDVREAFGELLAPLLTDTPFARELTLEAGARFTDHSTAGDSWTWKYGLQWRPVEDLKFSAMVQRAVRAPNIGELDTTPALSVQRLNPALDFCAASNDPVGAGLTNVCVAQGMSAGQVGTYDPAFSYNYNILSGGNPALRPEVADTITAGVNWRSQGPIATQVSLDYVRVKLRDAIEDFGPVFDLSECALSADPASAACRVIHRNPDGTVSSIDSVPINFAHAVIESLDFSLDAEMEAPSWASAAPGAEIGLEFHASHYLQNASALSPAEPLFDCVGFFACGSYDLQGAVTPATVATTSFTYSAGPFSALLRWRWIDGVDNVATKAAAFYGDPIPVLAIPRLAASSYVDLAVQYDIGENARLRAGVDNVFEAGPPQMASDQVQANTDPARYDVFGRRFFLAVNYRFGN